MLPVVGAETAGPGATAGTLVATSVTPVAAIAAGLYVHQGNRRMPPLTWPALSAPTLTSWHAALALTLILLGLYWLARVQTGRASVDFSNAFFYAPSQKELHRQRQRRWRRIGSGLLAATALAAALTVWLYVLNGRS